MSKKSTAEKLLLWFVIWWAALWAVGLAKTEKWKKITWKISDKIWKTSSEIMKQMQDPKNQKAVKKNAKTIWHILNKFLVKK